MAGSGLCAEILASLLQPQELPPRRARDIRSRRRCRALYEKG